MSEYNGWTNYETWVVNLWQTNDEETAREIETIAAEFWSRAIVESAATKTSPQSTFRYRFGDYLRQQAWNNRPLCDQPSAYADLLNAALDNVNWREIVEHYLPERSES